MPSPLRRRIGQLVVAGFAGTAIPSELRALARDAGLGGIILFGRNVESPEQVAELACAAHALPGELPPWVSVDQEGGRVARLPAPFTRWPPMRALGRLGDEALASRFARALARELRAVGISLDHAPVLDVDTCPENPVIGDRALSGDAERTARLGAVIVGALQAAGVAACGKHFPGHGDTDADSHAELPVVDRPADRLRAVELSPFRAAVEAGVATVMTAHVRYPALDAERPATLSRPIVDLLKAEMGFDGLLMTDDMEMAAITGGYAVEDAAVRAVAAGCDMVLLCGADPDRQAGAVEALIRAVEDERLPRARVEDALLRQERVKARFLIGVRQWRPPAPSALRSLLGCGEHASIAEAMGQAPQ